MTEDEIIKKAEEACKRLGEPDSGVAYQVIKETIQECLTTKKDAVAKLQCSDGLSNILDALEKLFNEMYAKETANNIKCNHTWALMYEQQKEGVNKAIKTIKKMVG